jgi:putative ABC transport system permease protein
MWRNFFIVALRNISKNRLFTLINIFGLAIGLASAILIILFIAKELSYDRFHENSKRIYRMYVDGSMADQTFTGAWTSYTMGPTFTREIDDVEAFVRMEIYPQQLVWRGEQKNIEDNIIFTDSTFFSVFSIRLLKGEPDEVLSKPNSVVITESVARKYFGQENPLGQTLEFNSPNNYYMVTGVMEDFPGNSHFYCDFLLSMSNLPESRSDDWFTNSIYTYLLLKPDIDYRKVEAEMNQVMTQRIREQLQAVLGLTPEEWNEGGNRYGAFLQPLTNIHLNPDIEVGSEVCLRPARDISYIYIFSLIAFFILVIASINFMNLTTARSAIRAREISMRKVVGSDRKVLILQFLSESVLLSLIALILAIFIVEISLPFFNRMMQFNLHFETLGRWIILSGVITLSIIVGLLSGIYPAFYLSQYEPLQGLRGQPLVTRRSALFRRAMVVIQFTISVAIIVGTMVVSKQAKFLITKDLGFNEESVVVIDRVYPLDQHIGTFCSEVEKIPGVVSATHSSTYLGFSNIYSSVQIRSKDSLKNYMFDVNYVDPDFFKTYGLTLASPDGRFFSDRNPSDTMTVLINQSAVIEYGLEDPLSTTIQLPIAEDEVLEYRIIGVVNDFHHSTLRKTISPYLFFYRTNQASTGGFVSIRFESDNMNKSSMLKKINPLWNKLTNDEPFKYFYLDEQLDRYYTEEERTGRLSLLFSILAILIACMGLFGLTMFSTERRIQEIGIRKAMGATIIDILFIVSRDIFTLLVISIGFAWIIAYFFLRNWLQIFPYNVGFTPGIYFLAAAVAVMVAMLSVSYIAIKAARSNPVESLHYE